MIGYFPAPYQDEMIYSVIARYHSSSLSKSVSNTMDELFSRRDYIIKNDFFRYSKRLELRLKHFSFYSEKEIIERFTFFRYYTKFIIKKFFFDLMINESSRIEKEIFNPKINLPNSRYYKFCIKCREEDLVNGVPYWRINHNLPGITLCSKHNCKLTESDILFNGKELTALSKEVKGTLIPKLSKRDEILLEKINNETINLFYSKDEFYEYKTQYISYLFELGYYDEKCLNEDKLKIDVACFYSDSICEVLNINKEITVSEISNIISGYNQAPLFHILFLIFCNKSIKNLNSSLLETPFGFPPFKCKNIACQYYEKENIHTFFLKDRFLDGIEGIFICSCGYTYSVLGGKDKVSIISYGEVFLKYLTDLVFNQDMELNVVCRELNIDMDVIKKHLPAIKGGIGFRKYTKRQFRDSFTNEMNFNVTTERLFKNNNLDKVIIWLKSNDINWLRLHSDEILRYKMNKYI